MANSFVASKAQLIYALCLPLAVLMGYFLASPTDFSNVAIIVALASLLMVPVLMKHYHPILIACWNAAITPYFIPGAPHLWMLMAIVGFGFAAVNRFTSPKAQLIEATWINRSLGALLLIVTLTALLRGGIGVRAMGSASYGGKHYIYIISAILGYYAIISQRVPLQKAGIYVAVFFLSALTALVPNLAFLGGPGLYFLYYLFPAFLAQEQAVAAMGLGSEFSRFVGLTFASIGFYSWLLAKYGLRGLFDWKHPWRVLLFILAFAGCLFTGFRSFLALFTITVCVQFLLEGLHRTRALPTAIAILVVAAGLALPNAQRLPPVVQRSLSFLPIEISPAVRQTAVDSSDWRFKMWQDLSWQVPKYFFLGKGYAISPAELDFVQENTRRGFSPLYSEAMIAGNYHSGPLTLVISLGIGGVLAFLAFLVGSLRYLIHQFKHGNPALKSVNRFILGFFIARILLFFFVYGAFSYDLCLFTGLIGLSISLNGAVSEAPTEPEDSEEEEELDFGREEDSKWNGI